MTFDARRQDFSREHIYVVEIDGDYCALTYSNAPCTASIPTTGSQECFNTLASCQDPDNYDEEGLTYRFCEPRSPHPLELEAAPSLLSVRMAPAEIDIGGGLGVRSNVSLVFNDHPSSDIGIDKYLANRSYIATDVGTFWTKWRSRNPYYQGRPLRVLSGYLVDGVFDEANFQERHYVIESLDVYGGRAYITAKDPLKLADSDRAQAPAASLGALDADITDSTTTFTLSPSGIGSDYPSSNAWVRVGSEVMEITGRSGDDLTVTRGQYNTAAAAHSEDDAVQLCLYYNDQPNDIIEDLLTTYAGIDSSFIPSSTWQAEADSYMTGLLETLITEPVGVKTLLRELGEQAPHYLYWDERTQLIQMVAIKEPPLDPDPVTQADNILADSFRLADQKDLRVSNVFVYFGQFDPTQKLDEVRNYQQTYVRIDADSIANYGGSRIKTIYSRWINNDNKAAAIQLATKIGRRFSDVPRMASWSMDPKDASIWAGQTVEIEHRDIAGFTGAPEPTPFEIISVGEEGARYQYKALEYLYGPELAGDEGTGDPDVDLVVIGGDQDNINLRTIYDGLFPSPDASTEVKVIIDTGVTIGSASTGSPALDTGTWPAGATLTLENRGLIVGRGGDGAQGDDAGAGDDGGAGGDAINMQYDMDLNNLGIIGGGGGGGGGAYLENAGTSDEFWAGGGGGAGHPNSSGAPSSRTGTAASVIVVNGFGGTDENGGGGGICSQLLPAITRNANGGDGGDLGDAGSIGAVSGTYTTSHTGSGGAAGKAIDVNGNTLTYIAAGDIRGTVS